MVEEPDNLVLTMLREIRSKQEQHDREFAKLNRKIDDWSESTVMALGLASHANIQNDHLQADIAELQRRLDEDRAH